MEEYMEAEGTKAQVIEAVMQTFSLDRDASKGCLDFIRDHQKILSDEEFFQFSKLEEYEMAGVSEFVSEEGEYYISIKKSTVFLAALYLRNKIPFFKNMKDIAGFFGIGNLKGAYLKLDTFQGYMCIMLELAKNRRCGADKSLLKKFKGECCNNQLECKYQVHGQCSCNTEIVEGICEDLWKQGVVDKKGRKYFYIL